MFVMIHVSVLLLDSLFLSILFPLHVELVSTACCTGEGQGKSIFIKVAWRSLKTTGGCMTTIDGAPSCSGSLSPWWCSYRCALSWPLESGLNEALASAWGIYYCTVSIDTLIEKAGWRLNRLYGLCFLSLSWIFKHDDKLSFVS